MRAGELCIRDIAIARPDETAVDAARRMADLRVGDVIVVEERAEELPHPIGIVTDRDLVVDVLAHPERPAAGTRLAELLHRDLITAEEDEDVETVVEKMRVHGIRRIPIVDRRGGLQGVLSLDDLVGWMRDQLQAAAKLLARQGEGPHARAGG